MTQKSRRELIEWIRSLGIEISAIEELGRGVVICRILSIIHKDFPSNFVRNPIGEHDYLRNMKICQEFFGLRNIKLYFPIDRLVKCKMQDNLEVAQWLAKYYFKNMGERHPREGISSRSSKAPSPLPSTAVHCSKCRNITEVMALKENRIKELEDTIAEMRDQVKQMEDEQNMMEQALASRSVPRGFDDDEVKSLLMTFEKERDFYFKKLFTIEKYFLERKGLDEDLKNDVLGILYEENAE
ncbi:microtubule-binding protein BIM1 [Encephalitozoon intestinalis ATCC 50506]|uniref:EB1 C-terminal domain-containing protein n=1 Tax=Encephalitozoon intestinalis (strain ATCC 50506) TaxID=876142 RepID=E0S5H1_ENCIT|nr:microtubule-binding protein BIM1 [Encephalitozoon intestinalis ATCC 50506]ADM10956.1 hypothetical protein Eint_010940 [Encephalitozoon intestinalis ATCC 50506]UTX44592.1 hypothetical protein GPK93_01g01020 [Encephalitozoon intestinalis]